MTKRYLIVQLADIGDLILSTPALAALREAQPDAHIALLTTAHSAPILNGTALVDEIITFDKGQVNSSKAFLKPSNLRRIFALRKGQYDVVLFFHHFTLKLGTIKFGLIGLATGAKRRIGLDNGNGWFLTEQVRDEGFGARHQAQYWLDLVGIVGADTTARGAVVGVEEVQSTEYRVQSEREEAASFQLPVSSQEIQSEKTGENSSGARKRVVIHAGSGGYSLARRWEASKFAALADRLHTEQGVEIVLVGGKGDDGEIVKEGMKAAPIDLTGKTTLNQLASVIKGADLFIGADSGVMHIAAAVGTPVVAIFGPSNPDAWGPWNPGGKTIVVRGGAACSPCSYVGHEIGLREGCPARTSMKMVSVEQVYRAAKAVLEGRETGEGLKLSPTKARFHNRVRILGLPVDGVTYAEWLEMIEEWMKEPHPTHSPQMERSLNLSLCRHVCTINPEFMMIARKDVNFRNILNRADLCVPDGVGLLWAARRRGHRLPERVTGSDGVPIIAEKAAKAGWKLFFLGAAPGTADKAADVLRRQYPGLQIVGTYSGSPAPEEEDALVQMVNESGAELLFVAYGAPEQDKWIARNLPRLNTKMAMGVGGAFDFIAGIMPRAPMWMRQVGLEWLYRLYLQPWRIRRMMRLPLFVAAVVTEKSSVISKKIK
jgi:exopolysaccharide biosynthesis WecB/TagA/CpsF family protein